MIKKATGFYETFERKDGSRTTHYCPGCGHGIIHKLIAEAMADLGIQDNAVFVTPVGCGAFCYYYFDTGNVAAAHGRASAVATGLARALDEKVVIAYQGDGDVGAIGFNNAFQAANRGEKYALFFVNNTIYAMTGGQLAPTTMVGQKTTTTPFGRDAAKDGHPLRICEIFDQLEAPVYIERVSVADTKRIMQAKKAVRKALEIQMEGKGFTCVEFLSPCPTNWRMDSARSAEFMINDMEKTFPLGCLRDRSAEEAVRPIEVPTTSLKELLGGDDSGKEPTHDPDFEERRFKFSGFGGQGILSLGLVIAKAAAHAGRYVSWFPSYGPEQRGGSASCSVAIGGKEIGSPTVDTPDVLVCMNQPSFEKFAPTVKKGGAILLEASVPIEFDPPEGVKLFAFPAVKIAAENGVPKAANTALLGCLTALELLSLPDDEVRSALDESFSAKPKLVEKNQRIFQAAYDWAKENLK